jgi:hypothetical protein
LAGLGIKVDWFWLFEQTTGLVYKVFKKPRMLMRLLPVCVVHISSWGCHWLSWLLNPPVSCHASFAWSAKKVLIIGIYACLSLSFISEATEWIPIKLRIDGQH